MGTYQDGIRLQIEEALDIANKFKVAGVSNPRELSLVITKLEEAQMWLTKV